MRKRALAVGYHLPVSLAVSQATLLGALFAGSIALSGCDRSPQAPASGPAVQGASDASAAKAVREYYTCPMHPEVIRDHPGTCPICHMTLVKKSTAEPGVTVPGRAPVTLSSVQETVAGIAPVEVKEASLGKPVSLPGRMTGPTQVSFQVFEEDLSYLRPGQAFVATSPSLPGTELKGRINSIDSILDPMTRTARVLGSLDSAAASRLRLENSITGVVTIALPEGPVIPEGAVLHTGSRDLVYVLTGEGSAHRYSPREVKLGAKAQGKYLVLDGLHAGEKVAGGPNFLLDSEARIRAAGQALAGDRGGDPGTKQAPTADPHAGHSR